MNAKTPSGLRPIDVPDKIPSYDEAVQMSRKLDAYFVRKNIAWARGREAFLYGIPRRKKIS